MEDTHHATVGIDFGTSGTTWAYSLLSQEIHSGGLKQRSDILLDAKGENVLGWGDDARSVYRDLLEEGSKDMRFFQQFKMCLYGEISSQTEIQIQDTVGRPFPAFMVIAHSLRYLKDKVILPQLHVATRTPITANDILWVLTVPAIWSNVAKNIMRRAAEEAGLCSSTNPVQLSFALEPEAASLFCLAHEERENKQGYAVGSVHLVVDAGAGTLDITEHKVIAGKRLVNLRPPTGAALGSSQVDFEFRLFLDLLFTASAMKTYEMQHAEDYMRLIDSFALTCKPFINPEAPKELRVQLPESFKQFFTNIPEILKNHPTFDCTNHVILRGEYLKLSYAVTSALIEPVVNQIIQCLKGLTLSCDTIFLVGGFGCSKYLQFHLRKHFPNMKIVSPPNAILAVVSGAVAYGLSPTSIQERIMNATYGIAVSKPWMESLDMGYEKVRHVTGGVLKDYCTDCFRPFVLKGSAVSIDQRVREVVSATNDEATDIKVIVYSTKTDILPRHIRDIKDLHFESQLEIPVNGAKDGITVTFAFGKAEITVYVVNNSSLSSKELKVRNNCSSVLLTPSLPPPQAFDPLQLCIASSQIHERFSFMSKSKEVVTFQKEKNEDDTVKHMLSANSIKALTYTVFPSSKPADTYVLKVQSIPNTPATSRFVYTNCIYTNSNFAIRPSLLDPARLEINGKAVYSLRETTHMIPPGNIALNAAQRKFLNVKIGDSVIVSKFSMPTQPATAITLKLRNVTTDSVITEIKRAQEFTTRFKEKFNGDVVSRGQSIVTEYNSDAIECVIEFLACVMAPKENEPAIRCVINKDTVVRVEGLIEEKKEVEIAPVVSVAAAPSIPKPASSPSIFQELPTTPKTPKTPALDSPLIDDEDSEWDLVSKAS